MTLHPEIYRLRYTYNFCLIPKTLRIFPHFFLTWYSKYAEKQDGFDSYFPAVADAPPLSLLLLLFQDLLPRGEAARLLLVQAPNVPGFPSLFRHPPWYEGDLFNACIVPSTSAAVPGLLAQEPPQRWCRNFGGAIGLFWKTCVSIRIVYIGDRAAFPQNLDSSVCSLFFSWRQWWRRGKGHSRLILAKMSYSLYLRKRYRKRRQLNHKDSNILNMFSC